MSDNKDIAVTDPTEIWRKRLLNPDLPTYNPKGEEIFYPFDEEYPDHSISLQGNIKGKKFILKALANSKGQLYVKLVRSKKTKRVYINFAMAEFFLKKNPQKQKVINKDGDNKNNHISNILYVKGEIKDKPQSNQRATSHPQGKIKPFRLKNRPISEEEEEARRKLNNPDFQFFDEDGEEQFYYFDEKHPNYTISLFGRVKGPRGIMKLGKEKSDIVRIRIPETLYVCDIMANTFMIKDSSSRRKMEIFHIDGDKLNNNIANIRLVHYGNVIKNPEVLIGMRKLILTEECKKRLKNPELPVYDDDGNVIFYDYIYDDKPSGYKVSMTGRILSPSGHILTDHPHPTKYIYTNLFIGSLKINTKVHVVVGDTFLITTNPKHENNHIDFDRGNNYVDNIEKVSHSENNKKRSPTSKCNKPLIEVDDEENVVRRWNKIIDFMEEFEIAINSYVKIKKYIQNFMPILGMNIRYKNDDKDENLDYQYSSFVFNKCSTPIIQTDINNVNTYWPSLKEAGSNLGTQKDMNRNISRIKKCINGELKSAFSSEWREATKEEIDEQTIKIPPSSEKYGNWTRLYIDDGSILISDLGYLVTSMGHVTDGFKCSEGYKHVKFAGKSRRINRLMIRAFDPDNYSEDLVVNHINGKKGDNRLVNLEIISQRDNIIHSSGVAVIGYKDDGKEIGPFRCVADAAEFCGINRNYKSNILRALKLGNISYGYRWKKV